MPMPRSSSTDAPASAELKRCAQRLWGADAGILQQYLFHAARMGIIVANDK